MSKVVFLSPTDQAPVPAERRFMHLWRAWWIKSTKSRQITHLDHVVTDPHLARDLGLPPRERAIPHPRFW